MSAENNCMPECNEFNMVLKLTDELSAMDDKVAELNKIIRQYEEDNIIQADREWVKTTFIEYCRDGGDVDSHCDIWDFFEGYIPEFYYGSPNFHFKIFYMMLEEILGLFDYDLKTESEIREDFMYNVGEVEYNNQYINKDIDVIIDGMDNFNYHFKEIPFDREGERVWWLIS